MRRSEVLEVVVLVLSLLGRVVGLVDELLAVLLDELDQLVLGVRGGALAQAIQDRVGALGGVNVGLQVVARALDAALQAVLLVNELLQAGMAVVLGHRKSHSFTW
jgi:hypothetical protein